MSMVRQRWYCIPAIGGMLFLLLAGCSSRGVYEEITEGGGFVQTDAEIGESQFVSKSDVNQAQFATSETVRDFSADIDDSYRFGPGDEFAFLVANRPNISPRT